MKTLISIEEIKNSTIINKNVDDSYIMDAIETAQTIKLQQLIGSSLLNKLLSFVGGTGDWTGDEIHYILVTDYIQPYLKRQVIADIIIPLNYKLRNEGFVQSQDNNIVLPSQKDAIFVKEHYEAEANFFAERMTKFIVEYSNMFPEYEDREGNVVANPKAKNTVIYLG